MHEFILHELELRLNHLDSDIRHKVTKFSLSNAEEVTEWLDRESSGSEVEEEDESGTKTPTCSTGTGKASGDMGRKFEDNGTPESRKKEEKTESPNVRLGVKRTINSPVSSPVTIKKLLLLKKMKTRKNKRKPVRIKKADSKILTSTPCRKVIEENHEKKTIKRQKKSEIAKKIEVFKKEVVKKERDEKKEMVNKARAQPGKKTVKKAVRKKKVAQRSGRRPRKTKKIPNNPKL